MKKVINPQACGILSLCCLALFGQTVSAGTKDDPLSAMVNIDRYETHNGDDENPLLLEGQAWVGYDLDKLWLKSDVEWADGDVEEIELQVLYSKAITPFWDMQLGHRSDFQPTHNPSNWVVIGLQGLAPYLFEVDTALFIGEAGRTGLRLQAEYELLFTQRLILTPEIEVNLYGQNDEDIGIGSGVSDAELGLRLSYEFRREFAPYIGVDWTKKFGNTARFSRAQGESSSEKHIVLGVQVWF